MAGYEKTVVLNGKEYNLIANAVNAIVYETQFGRDLFPDMVDFLDVFDDADNGERVFNVKKVKSAIGQRLFWTMARCYDPKFPPFDKWIKELDAFRIMNVLFDLMDLVKFNIKEDSDIKSKNIEAVENEN